MSRNGTHKLPPSSSALIALSSLTPPSPILSPTQLSTTWTSMEISVFLDFDPEELAYDSPRHIYRESGSSFLLGMNPSSSISTIGTVGTFGPTRNKHKFSEYVAYSDVAATLMDAQSAYSPSDSHSTSILDVHMARSTSVLEQTLTPTRCFENDTCSIDQPVFDLTDVDPPLSLEAISCKAYDDVAKDNESPEMSINRGPRSPLDTSPLLSASESCLISARHRSTPSSPDNESELQVDAHTRKLAIAAALACLESRCDSAPSSPQGSRAHSPTRRVHASINNLPKNLAWLQKTTVEMLIDQEGFRGVLARFKFTGYSGQDSSGIQFGYGESGIVQFRPTERQMFKFHYAPLEGLPVLRRITVNGEETRDYISRQASLGIKSNGVYVVKGQETPSFPIACPDREKSHPSSSAESLKLHWRFEYLVDDRKVESLGKKTFDGEKVLTPLSFSCSPHVLHPLQGKRIRLMHVVKKSVAPNLTSEKMEPPTFSPSTRSPSPSSPGDRRPVVKKTHLQSTIPCSNPKSPHAFPWNIHRRAMSHAAHQMEGQDVSTTESRVSSLTTTIVDTNTTGLSKVTRRRRASSAGERSRPGAPPRSSEFRVQVSSPRAPPVYHPARHIIARSRLAALVDNDVEDTIPPQLAVKVSLLQAEPLLFLPLSPSPRHHHAHCRPTTIIT